MIIKVLDGYRLNPGDLSWDGLKEIGQTTVYDRTSPEEIFERIKDADVVLTNKVQLTSSVLNSLPKLKYIGVLATGYNVVDIKAAQERGIVVTNIPSYSTDSVAQLVFSHLLAIVSRVEHYTEENKQGKWAGCADFCYWDTPLHELAGKNFGIIGLGHIGSKVAEIAHAFGMKVIAYTSKDQCSLPEWVEKASLDRLFKISDVVSLHCPLNESTLHIVDESRLNQMKASSILINTGRGPLVDENALAEALNERKIYAAGIDVLSSEPPKADNPLLTARNCFITPHIGWATKEARERLMKITLENLKAFVAGSPINEVTNR